MNAKKITEARLRLMLLYFRLDPRNPLAPEIRTIGQLLEDAATDGDADNKPAYSGDEPPQPAA